MDRRSEEEELLSQIEQLRRERDELRKDIEQLCMQQAGPSFFAMATRIHFQRTTALELEIESLTKKLAIVTREKLNLEEELSEAYRIKGQVADLHSAEVLKQNKELEKQMKFFQSCVAAAFAERDHSIMEAERAKEHEEAAVQKLLAFENRLEELQIAFIEEKTFNSALQMEFRELAAKMDPFAQIIKKFYDIRERDTAISSHQTWKDKCSCLLGDPSERWKFSTESGTSTSKYIRLLEKELEALQNSMEKLHCDMRMGVEIEHHLQRHVKTVEKKQVALASMIRSGFSTLRAYQKQSKSEIMKILDDERAHMLSMYLEVEKMIAQDHINHELKDVVQKEKDYSDSECKDVHISSVSSDINANTPAKLEELGTTTSNTRSIPDPSDALAHALKEKVAALLLLSQEEERHMLEREMSKALQEKIEELQRNLLQVTNEKVKALMELAEFKQLYQLSCEKASTVSDKSVSRHESEGKLRTVLKRTYLKRWIGKDHGEHDTDFHGTDEESSPNIKRSYHSIDVARLKVENAALKECMATVERLTALIHRLRLSLHKVQEVCASASSSVGIEETLGGIIREAKQMKTALSSSLPVSWSAETSGAALLYGSLYEETDSSSESRNEKVDTVSAAGLEMVELVIMAANLLNKISTSQLPIPEDS